MAQVDDIDIIDVTIANGQSLSPAVALGGKSLVGIVMPAAWTAAALTFQATADDPGTDNGAMQELQDGTGNPVTLTVNAGTFVQVDPTKWRGTRHITVRSGTVGAPVAQGASRTLGLAIRSIF
jgi:hypothetical protein